MSSQAHWFKPIKKPAVGMFPAAVSVLLILVFYFAFPILLYAFAFIAAAIAIFRAVLVEREPSPKQGRNLEVSEECLRQYDEESIVSEIELTHPFEYEILDRYDVNNAVFRLHQRDNQLTFYFADPGGAEVVKEVMQIEWPPKNRHAGRSYPPTAG